MNDLVISGLRLVLLLVLYLFFARVVWAVWSEVHVPVSPQGSPDANATGATSRLLLQIQLVFSLIDVQVHHK